MNTILKLLAVSAVLLSSQAMFAVRIGKGQTPVVETSKTVVNPETKTPEAAPEVKPTEVTPITEAEKPGVFKRFVNAVKEEAEEAGTAIKDSAKKVVDTVEEGAEKLAEGTKKLFKGDDTASADTTKETVKPEVVAPKTEEGTKEPAKAEVAVPTKETVKTEDAVVTKEVAPAKEVTTKE